MESKQLRTQKQVVKTLTNNPDQIPEAIKKTQKAQVAPSPKDLFTNLKYSSAYSGKT